jgi:hypothetical protein
LKKEEYEKDLNFLQNLSTQYINFAGIKFQGFLLLQSRLIANGKKNFLLQKKKFFL